MPDELDGEVLARFVQGDREAFEALFRQFEREVYRWALRIVREPPAAEEVVVEAFWRAYRGRARFDATRSFGAWIRRIATNVARDYLRATRSQPATTPATDQLPARGTAGPINESVVRAFHALPPKLRLVATLALIEERPYAEIADALGIPLGTVKSRVFRATRALRTELNRLGIRP